VSRETQDAALLAALTRYRVVVGVFESAERVAWTDAAIAKVGTAAAQGLPAHWTIYETHPHLRDEITKVIKAVERYNFEVSTKGK
jgi:hypothetical protein